MVFSDVLDRVELPHSDPKRWNKLQALYQRLFNINDSETLVLTLREIYQESGHTGKDFYDFLGQATGFGDAASNSKFPFSGLQIFLDDFLNESERKKFYKKTLPFIANLAYKLDEYTPAEGIKVSCHQEPCSIPLDRKFIASLIASGFLCALPEKNSSIATRAINFADVFANFHRSELKDVQGGILQSVLCYFERLASSDFDLSGEIILQRQVVNKSSLPSLTDWTNCDTKLCPLIVDNQRKITNTDATFLQVDFSDCFAGRNLLGNKHGKQELHFCTYPELLVTSMFMGKMEENESLLIKGAERFSTLDISGKGVVHFAGDFQDSTERDICGNLQRSVASVSLIEDCDTQNEDELVLRLLNKALVCFYSQGTPCSLFKMTDKDGINNGYQEEMKKDKSGQSENYEHEKDADELGDFEEEEDESGIAYIEDKISEINGNIQLNIDQFCDSLVSRALSDAKGEICVKPRAPSEDTREVFENLMKKSVREVFKSSPEKQQKYEEKIIDSLLIPKCMQSRTFIYEDNSPLVPGTPPSSPTKRSLVTSGNHFPVSGIAPPNTPLSEEVKLGTTSFADSLAESLMSCVMLSSTLATSIATIAATPLRSTSVAMETLQQSPVKRGQQILSSFLSSKANFVENSFANGGGEFGLIDLSTENDVEDKSILYVDDTSEEENEARRRSLNELALNLFQDFASKLADSILKSATGMVCEDVVLEDIDEEHMRDDDDDDAGEDGGGDDDDFDDYNNSNENRSGDLESDEDYNPENSNETNNNKPHDIEANTDNKESNHESQSIDSDSDEDSTEEHWEDLDIDKQLEDKLYELDLTDNEEISNNDHHNSVAEMADAMANKVLSGAYPEVIRELKEKAELYVEAPEMQDRQLDLDLEPKLSLPPDELPSFPENGVSTELYFGYAKNFSTRILKEALVDVSRNIETDGSDGNNSEISSKTENTEKEEKSFLYSVEDLSEEFLDENANVKLEKEEERDSGGEFESGEISSKEFNIERYTSISEGILDEFAHVLSEQLLETSVAIADSSVQLQDESLLMRPIATGSWSFERLASDPELEAVIQWVAASAVGCPAVVYYTSGDIRLEKFSKVQQVLRLRDWRIRDVMRSIMRYCQQDKASQVTKSNLFQMLLEECQASY